MARVASGSARSWGSRVWPAVREVAPWAALLAFAVVALAPRPGTPRGAPERGHGRMARRPAEVPPLGWRDILWRTWREMRDDRLSSVAASVTYYTLLAVFPAVGVFVSLYGLFADVGAVREQLVQLGAVFPPEAVALIGDQMMRLANGKASGLSIAFLVSLLLSLWSANAGMKSLFDGLNIAYDETETRSFLRRTAVTYAFTAALIVFLVLVSGLLVAAPLALESVGVASGVLIALRWLLVLAIAAGAFAVAYRYGPSREPARWRWLVPGAALASVLWLAGSAGFSFYLNHAARLDATYGSLGAVVAFMLWVWFSAMVVLAGAELNAEIEHQTLRDSTTGAPLPMGVRGATMADTVGEPFRGFRAGKGRASRTLPQARPDARPDPRRSAD